MVLDERNIVLSVDMGMDFWGGFLRGVEGWICDVEKGDEIVKRGWKVKRWCICTFHG